ncbi:MAG: sulfatase [Prolixibacteraceae bacterium]|jgi:arylsulfatase A-like enzyme|nr:sulfatase [Prolixibacteraceae bacterium]MBT6997279.1 sulfatase [Prolixibacteraceae bacterium]MBT7396862.1 sulfatase [Prolixibacteraceae bacterium]
MNQLKFLTSIFFLFALLTSCDTKQEEVPQKPNILFIAVDDLRIELGCYGNEHIQSPNLDKLASQGFLFTRHYVGVPTCGASRHCLLTGQLPVSVAHTRNDITANTIARQPESEVPETFIHQLKRNGYYTVGIGKITHHPDGYVYGYLDEPSDVLELPHSWDEMLMDDEKWGSGHNAFFGYADGSNRHTHDKNVKPYEMADVEDESYPDGLTANLAIKKLSELKDKGQPFFLGVGFFKPHLPFTAPKKYWDMYNEAELPVAPFAGIPENSSKASLHGSGEFNQYKLGEEKASLDAPVSDEYARKARHAYFACVSFIDAQVGKLMNELDELGLAENTIVVVWGDHGWHLGDQLVWGKHTIFDRSLHSTFMMKVPGMENGKTINKIVSTADIYPTLMELCGTPVNHDLSGSPLTDLMKNHNDENWRNTAYSYWRKGYSVRTEDYRLMKYYRKEEPAIELYDHKNDPFEAKNIAPESPEIVERLLPVLELGNSVVDYKKNTN